MNKAFLVIIFLLFSYTLFSNNQYSLHELPDDNYARLFVFFENYEYESNDFKSRFILPIIIFGAIFLNIIRKLDKKNFIESIKEKSFTIIIVVLFSSFWLLNWYPSHIKSNNKFEEKFQQYKKLYENKNYQVIEGIVEVLYEQPASGHAPGDKIKINDEIFEFSYFIANALYYHNTIAHNGVLIHGRNVRLHHIDNKIIEIFDIK